MSDDEEPKGDDGKVLVFRRPGDQRPVAVPPEVVIASERPYRAYQLKVSGARWEDVALAESYPTPEAARADVERYLAEGKSLVEEFRRKELLSLEIARLDALQLALWPLALQGNIAAVNSAMSLVMNRAKLLRLDQDIREDENTIEGRTVVAPVDEEGYAAALRRAADHGLGR